MKKSIDKYKTLSGYDNHGVVYDTGKYVVREIHPDYTKEGEIIYKSYQDCDLKKLGIVNTEYDCKNNSFIHKKHIISYPYEWTANMFKDAVLFHLDLFLELDKFGLTLKDAIPSNILFDLTKPVFVDFLSLVKKEKLKEESWLVTGRNYSDPRFAVIDIMLIPFIIIPYLGMTNKNYKHSRLLLFKKACNSPYGAPSWKEINHKSQQTKVNAILNRLNYRVRKFLLLFLRDQIAVNFKYANYIHKLKNIQNYSDYNHLINDIKSYVNSCDVTPSESGYISYYAEKKEDFNYSTKQKWGTKQKNVYKILKAIKPKRVLDIGANTGWFSRLAEKLGAEVIATDIDESAIDLLYINAKENNLRILPLLLSFEDFTRKLFGVVDNDPVYSNRDFKNNPLFLPAVERLKSDLVLCLGLLHHLLLGSGESLENVFSVLAELTLKTLIVEFVDLNDPLIIAEPSFFKNLNNFSKNNYNIDIVISEGLKKFKMVELFDSHPETRKLIIFNK